MKTDAPTPDPVAMALEALHPFAATAEHDISNDESDVEFYRPMKFNRAPNITVGHIRRAAEAYATLSAPRTAADDGRAVEVLRKVEWGRFDDKCPCCGFHKAPGHETPEGGHWPKCELADVLSSAIQFGTPTVEDVSWAEAELEKLTPSPVQPRQDIAPAGIFTVDYDGFTGTKVGSYTTLEGKRGVVLQQVGTRVVHVYGEARVRPASELSHSDAPAVDHTGDVNDMIRPAPAVEQNGRVAILEEAAKVAEDERVASPKGPGWNQFNHGCRAAAAAIRALASPAQPETDGGEL